MSELGLTPTSRSRLAVNVPTGIKKPWETDWDDLLARLSCSEAAHANMTRMPASNRLESPHTTSFREKESGVSAYAGSGK